MAGGPSAGRLFWKLMLALSIALLASIASTTAYFRMLGFPGSEPRALPLIFGLVPIEPLISGVVFFLIAGLVLAWYLSRPLSHLSWGLREISAGRLETRVSALMHGRRDEIADLAHDFDAMAARLQQLTESRRVLLHDVSHELRSPLSRMQAAIGLLRQSPASPGEMLGRIEREADRLDQLIGELLTLHRLEAGTLPVAGRSRVDLVELLHAIVEDADFEARQTGSSVACEAGESFVTEVNAEHMYRAFENVVRNAVKYTLTGTAITVRARTTDDGGTLVVSVQDRGPGVPVHLLRTIFEPFVRVEGSEQKRGVGLGLAIAQRAVLLHGGRIDARLRDGGGLDVVMQIPREAATRAFVE
jgi:signal transduction histidine kinase